jgi:hypothetical protein
VQVFVIMYALHQIIGLIPTLAGVLAMLLVAPFNVIMGSLVHRCRLQLIAKTDARVKIMTEVINGTLSGQILHFLSASRWLLALTEESHVGESVG